MQVTLASSVTAFVHLWWSLPSYWQIFFCFQFQHPSWVRDLSFSMPLSEDPSCSHVLSLDIHTVSSGSIGRRTSTLCFTGKGKPSQYKTINTRTGVKSSILSSGLEIFPSDLTTFLLKMIRKCSLPTLNSTMKRKKSSNNLKNSADPCCRFQVNSEASLCQTAVNAVNVFVVLSVTLTAPYQDLVLTVNHTTNTATCSARGGYPAARVSWKGQNRSSDVQLDLQDAETLPQQDPTEKTFSFTRSVNVTGLKSVTCIVYNSHSYETMTRTEKIDAGERSFRSIHAAWKHLQRWLFNDS